MKLDIEVLKQEVLKFVEAAVLKVIDEKASAIADKAVDELKKLAPDMLDPLIESYRASVKKALIDLLLAQADKIDGVANLPAAPVA